MQDAVDMLFKAAAHMGVALSGHLLLGIGIRLRMWLLKGWAAEGICLLRIDLWDKDLLVSISHNVVFTLCYWFVTLWHICHLVFI